MSEQNQNPPPFVTPPPLPVSDPLLIDTRGNVSAKYHTKAKPHLKPRNYLLAGLAALFAVVIYGWWPGVAISLRAKNAEQRLVLSWVMETEGDPNSVEIIKLEGPRKTAGDKPMVRIKYRAIGPFGGPIVMDKHFTVEDGGVYFNKWNHYRWADARFTDLDN